MDRVKFILLFFLLLFLSLPTTALTFLNNVLYSPGYTSEPQPHYLAQDSSEVLIFSPLPPKD